MKDSQKGSAGIIVIVVAALVVGGGYYLFSSQKGGDLVVEENHDETMMKEGVMEETPEARLLAGSREEAPLYDFTQASYEEALKSDKLIVIYFYAKWCPVCRAEFPYMQEVFDELGGGAIGFRVNFNDDDTDSHEKALAREFGVAYQHTKVFVKNGERVLKSPEGWSKERYLEEIASFIN